MHLKNNKMSRYTLNFIGWIIMTLIFFTIFVPAVIACLTDPVGLLMCAGLVAIIVIAAAR